MRPIFIGDTVTTSAEIVDKRDHATRTEHGLIDERVTDQNEDGEVVLALVHVYLVERRPRASAG